MIMLAGLRSRRPSTAPRTCRPPASRCRPRCPVRISGARMSTPVLGVRAANDLPGLAVGAPAAGYEGSSAQTRVIRSTPLPLGPMTMSESPTASTGCCRSPRSAGTRVPPFARFVTSGFHRLGICESHTSLLGRKRHQPPCSKQLLHQKRMSQSTGSARPTEELPHTALAVRIHTSDRAELALEACADSKPANQPCCGVYTHKRIEHGKAIAGLTRWRSKPSGVDPALSPTRKSTPRSCSVAPTSTGGASSSHTPAPT